MKLAKNLLGGLAIAGLAFAQPVAAKASATRSLQSLPSAGAKASVTGARAGAVKGQAEALANNDSREAGAIWWVAGLALATGLFVWAVVDHDDDGLPASPG